MQLSAPRKPEIIQTAKESFVAVADSFLPALSAGGVPLVVAFAVMLAGVASGNAVIAIATLAAFFVLIVPSFVAVMLVAQARVIGVDIPTAPGALFREKQFWKCVAAAVGVWLVSASIVLVALAPGFMSMATGARDDAVALTFAIGFIVGFPAAAYVGLRMNLLVPSLVAGQPFSVSGPWALANGNVLGMFVSSLLCSIPVSIAQSLVESSSKGSEQAAVLVMGGILTMVLAMAQCMLTGAVSGIYYRELTGGQRPL